MHDLPSPQNQTQSPSQSDSEIQNHSMEFSELVKQANDSLKVLKGPTSIHDLGNWATRVGTELQSGLMALVPDSDEVTSLRDAPRSRHTLGKRITSFELDENDVKDGIAVSELLLGLEKPYVSI